MRFQSYKLSIQLFIVPQLRYQCKMSIWISAEVRRAKPESSAGLPKTVSRTRKCNENSIHCNVWQLHSLQWNHNRTCYLKHSESAAPSGCVEVTECLRLPDVTRKTFFFLSHLYLDVARWVWPTPHKQGNTEEHTVDNSCFPALAACRRRFRSARSRVAFDNVLRLKFVHLRNTEEENCTRRR